jgi:hypothetical protein
MLTAAGRLFGGLVLGAFTGDAIVRLPAVSQPEWFRSVSRKHIE